MALKLNFKKKVVYTCAELKDTMEQEVTYPDCYVVVGNISGNKNVVRMRVDYYEDSSKKKLLQNKFMDLFPSVADDSENFIKQGYEYLKTLEEFKDAEDC